LEIVLKKAHRLGLADGTQETMVGFIDHYTNA
jgi:hypothetical protein